jgi:hypothetical protein
MAWHPETPTHVEEMFDALSVFDVWSQLDFFRVGKHSTRPGLTPEQKRERQRRLCREWRLSNTSVDVSLNQVAQERANQMAAMRAAGVPFAKVAEAFGVSKTTVIRAVKKVKLGLPVLANGGHNRIAR